MKARALYLLPLLCACTSIVPSTIAKLNSISPFEADPAALAVSLRLPDGVGIQEGSAKLAFSAMREDTEEESSEEYVLNTQLSADGLFQFAVSEADFERLRAQQDLIGSWESEAPNKTSGSVGVALGGCRTEADLATDATLDINIRTEVEGPFFPLVQGAKLTQAFKVAGISELPPCG